MAWALDAKELARRIEVKVRDSVRRIQKHKILVVGSFIIGLAIIVAAAISG